MSSESKGKLGALLILDVDLPVLTGVQGQYNSVDMAGQKSGPGDTAQLRKELLKSGIKVSCQIANKEVFMSSSTKKYDTIILNGLMLSVKNKSEFCAALKKSGAAVYTTDKERVGLSKSGETKISKKNFNIFK